MTATAAATTATAVYIHKEESGFSIKDINGDKWHCWLGDKVLSVFNWGELLTALRTDMRLQGRQIIPHF
jgi:hypothetical protein